MRVVAGNWSKLMPARIKRTFMGKPYAIEFQKHFFATERVWADEIEDVQIVTENNKKSLTDAAIVGAAGGLVLGGVGVLAGVLAGGNSKEIIVSLKLTDGRRALLECKPKEFEALCSMQLSG